MALTSMFVYMAVWESSEVGRLSYGQSTPQRPVINYGEMGGYKTVRGRGYRKGGGGEVKFYP